MSRETQFDPRLSRAVVVNAQVKKGDNVLITGIGGGVALIALQISLALGANVYVTSGHEDKIKRAISLGAKGGVNYRAGQWFLHAGISPRMLMWAFQKMTGLHSSKLC